MLIRFDFDPRKSVQAMAYLLSKMPGQKTDKVKLMKLLYLADREHFLQEGRPITGDDQYAMPFGPVPTLSLDLLNGQFADGEDADIFTYLRTGDREVSLRKIPEPFGLGKTELRILDAVLERYGAMDTWDLCDFTHRLPEYLQVFRPGTSTRIPFDLLLEIYRKGTLFRHNRPVVTSAMAAHMFCPFDRSEADL
jgi:uncharacterized phage-associated protein